MSAWRDRGLGWWGVAALVVLVLLAHTLEKYWL